MERRSLGRCQKTAGVIGLTTRRLASPTTRKSTEKLIHRAIDLGIDYLDTSREWGEGWGEECVAGVLRQRRNELTLACHCPYPDAACSRACLEGSLRNLGTDHIDLLIIDQVDKAEDLEAVLGAKGAAKARARQEGLIGALGISARRPSVLLRAIESGRFDLVQSSYHAARPHLDRAVLPAAVRHDVGVIAEDPWFEDLLSEAKDLPPIRLADGREISESEAVRFVLCESRISVALAPLHRMGQLRALIALGNGYEPMSAQERRAFIRSAREALARH